LPGGSPNRPYLPQGPEFNDGKLWPRETDLLRTFTGKQAEFRSDPSDGSRAPSIAKDRRLTGDAVASNAFDSI
jgi:hypothetical protein